METLVYFQKGFNYSQDGPGNRLVYHLYGCDMRCPWCANPECFAADTRRYEVTVGEIMEEAFRSRPMFFDGGGVTFTGGEATLRFDALSTLFDGTREDPTLRGSITGISVENLHAVDLMSGFLQGIADELHRFYAQMRENGVCPEARVMIGAGNGLRYNPTLCRAMERVFGLPLELSTVSEEAAVGAAEFAAVL